MEYFNNELQFYLKVLGCYLVVIPLEYVLAKDTHRIFKNRLINLGAGFIFIVLGGKILQILGQEFASVYHYSKISNAWLYTLCNVLLTDFFFYCYHRLQHAIPLLWKLHRLHHSDPDMNISTSFRTNIFETVVQFLVVVLPTLFILGYHPQGSLYSYYVLVFLLMFSHMKLNFHWGALSRILVNPQQHRIHHSSDPIHRNTNFAQVSPLFDILGKTYYHPKKDEYPVTGIK